MRLRLSLASADSSGGTRNWTGSELKAEVSALVFEEMLPGGEAEGDGEPRSWENLLPAAASPDRRREAAALPGS